MTATHRFCIVSALLLAMFCGVALPKQPEGELRANAGICDQLHDATPGLFGLCVAFCETQICQPDLTLENPFANCKPASTKILDRYNATKNVGDPDMPCLVVGDCLCFSRVALQDIPPQQSGEYSQCDDTPPITNIVASWSPLNAAQVDETADPPLCLLVLEDEGVLRSAELTPERAEACRQMLVSTIEISPYCP